MRQNKKTRFCSRLQRVDMLLLREVGKDIRIFGAYPWTGHSHAPRR
jgi:hypothetical protein